jgi:hypothetical protein
MPAYSGKGAIEGPERSDISAHVFAGGHTEMLKKAAVVTLWAGIEEKSGMKRIKLTALVTNAGSGHLMPTGIPGIRQLWLDLIVKDSKGTEVFARQIYYGATLTDRDGNPAMPWKAVLIEKDTRIAPQESRKETFEFDLSGPEFDNLEALATLNYRLVSEQTAKSVGMEPTPPIEVAMDRILISSK